MKRKFFVPRIYLLYTDSLDGTLMTIFLEGDFIKKVKLKQPHYRPGQALRVPGV